MNATPRVGFWYGIEALLGLLDALRTPLSLTFDPAVQLLCDALFGGHKVLVCGNGGSAADASHLAAELLVRYRTDRKALPAVSLTDPAVLTACANDYDFAQVFARQVEALGRRGDVLVAISTSGKSKNVNEAVRRARFQGLGTLGLSGGKGIEAGCDVDIVVPSTVTARIQEAHRLVLHMLCEEIDARLPKGDDARFKQTGDLP